VFLSSGVVDRAVFILAASLARAFAQRGRSSMRFPFISLSRRVALDGLGWGFGHRQAGAIVGRSRSAICSRIELTPTTVFCATAVPMLIGAVTIFSMGRFYGMRALRSTRAQDQAGRRRHSRAMETAGTVIDTTRRSTSGRSGRCRSSSPVLRACALFVEGFDTSASVILRAITRRLEGAERHAGTDLTRTWSGLLLAIFLIAVLRAFGHKPWWSRARRSSV